MSPVQSIAILPAAGRSRRMGQPKLLLPWRGASVLEHVLATWRASRVTHVVLVIRSEDNALAEIARRQRVEVVRVDPPPPHMKDSVLAGLDFAQRTYAPAATDVWLLAPADTPRLSARVINQVLDAHDPARPEILTPRHGDRNGHPVLFPWPLAAHVATLGPDEGINVLRSRLPHRSVLTDDPTITDDLDTPDDYQCLIE